MEINQEELERLSIADLESLRIFLNSQNGIIYSAQVVANILKVIKQEISKRVNKIFII